MSHGPTQLRVCTLTPGDSATHQGPSGPQLLATTAAGGAQTSGHDRPQPFWEGDSSPVGSGRGSRTLWPLSSPLPQLDSTESSWDTCSNAYPAPKVCSTFPALHGGKYLFSSWPLKNTGLNCTGPLARANLVHKYHTMDEFSFLTIFLVVVLPSAYSIKETPVTNSFCYW